MATFRLRIPDDLAHRFDVLASTRGGRSNTLRNLIDRACTAQADPLTPIGPARGPVQLTLRLTKLASEALDQCAADSGLTRNAWVVALVQSRLMRTPTFIRGEEISLIAIQEDLRRMCFNINFAIRLIKESEISNISHHSNLQSLNGMRDEIRCHVDNIQKAFAGNAQYWSLNS